MFVFGRFTKHLQNSLGRDSLRTGDGSLIKPKRGLHSSHQPRAKPHPKLVPTAHPGNFSRSLCASTTRQPQSWGCPGTTPLGNSSLGNSSPSLEFPQLRTRNHHMESPQSSQTHAHRGQWASRQSVPQKGSQTDTAPQHGNGPRVPEPCHERGSSLHMVVP